MLRLVFAFLLTGTLAAYTQSKPKLTSTVFAELYAEYLTQALMNDSFPKTLLFTPAPPNTFQGMLDAALQSRLLAAGFTLYESPPPDEPNFATLEVYSLQADFSYQFLNPMNTIRSFALNFDSKLLSAQKQTLLVRHFALTRQDTLKVDELATSEDRRFAETFKPNLPSFWESAAAPLTIIGAIGIIVFLFFSVRSR